MILHNTLPPLPPSPPPRPPKMIPLQTLRPFITFTAATVASLTFTSLIDCQPSLFLWEWRFHRRDHHHHHLHPTPPADPPPNDKVAQFFHNKNVWIVGASAGIGKEMAVQMARAGCANLILTARHADRLDQVAAQCREVSASRCRCHCHVLDVAPSLSTRQQSADSHDLLEAHFQDFLHHRLPRIPIDVVVLNAGLAQLQPSLETSAQTVRHVMDVNALWPMILTPLLWQHKVFRSLQDGTAGGGDTTTTTLPPHLVVTNSIAAKLPVPLSAVYAASKAAQAQYFASLAAEQPEGSLRVDVICPGPVATDFFANSRGDGGTNTTAPGTGATTAASTTPSTTITDDGTAAKRNTDEVASAEAGGTLRKPRTKMSVERCARLILAATARHRTTSHQETWIAPPPLISVLYLQRLFPGLFQRLTTKFGQKRVALWRAGKDLYDPDSWK